MTQDAARTVLDAARHYLAQGWYPLPLPPRSKGAVLKGWPELRLTDDELPKHFSNNENIGLILGEPSGWLVDVDLDCPEAIELADQFLPPTEAVTGRSSAPRSHRWYVCHGAQTVKHHDPHTGKMIVELRSTGGQTVVGPSIHPEGDTYDSLVGDPAEVSRQMLEACVAALAQAVCQQRHPEVPTQGKTAMPRRLEADDFDIERRAIAYLDSMPPAVSGSRGHAATFTAAVALVHGFGIDPERALGLLATYYNPHCNPKWTEKELRHKVDSAAKTPHEKPYGWLREEVTTDGPEVDLSRLTVTSPTWGRESPPEPVADEKPRTLDPGAVPAEMLRVPGFVGELMDFNLQTAPYPNPVLAFCGALAMQAFLAGRKVRDQADNRTNIYLLGLAYSASGKDWPRKMNMRIAHQIGMGNAVGDRFASGEGIEDALLATPTMLFQTDEIDGILQAINHAKDARHEKMMGSLLTLYSSANSVLPSRRKAANNGEAVMIDQPCLVLFGTAIPNHYYAALSQRMLTNGFFARMLILESGPRCPGQEPVICDVPPRVMDAARWWAKFSPTDGNLQVTHPVPAVVEYTAEAQEVLIETRREADHQYNQAQAAGDPVGTTVWGRVNEQTRKLALLYAISENHRSPRVTAPAAHWAMTLVGHQTRRMLFMVDGYVAENPFHAECLKVIQKLRDAPGEALPHSVLLKRMKVDAQTFQKIIQTMMMQGDITVSQEATPGRARVMYRLAGGTKGERSEGRSPVWL